jgi:hypothetical protein
MQSDLFAPKEEPRGQWPSEQLNELLGGKIAWDRAPPAIRSWSAFFIYEAAQQLIKMPDKEKRRIALGKIPSTIRHVVEDEVKRLWPSRTRQ